MTPKLFQPLSYVYDYIYIYICVCVYKHTRIYSYMYMCVHIVPQKMFKRFGSKKHNTTIRQAKLGNHESSKVAICENMLIYTI